MYIVWLNFHIKYIVSSETICAVNSFFFFHYPCSLVPYAFNFFNLETETPVNEGNKGDSSQNEHISSAVSSKELFTILLID